MSPGHGPTPIQRRTTRNIVLGILFFVLGVIGILIPVMPQVVFFFLSALFFSLVSPRLRRAHAPLPPAPPERRQGLREVAGEGHASDA